MAGDLPLELPGVTVGVENAVAEEVLENFTEEVAFLVDGEVGLEDVLNHSRVGGDNEAAAQRVVHSDGRSGRVLEKLSEPWESVGIVLVEGRE